MKSFRSLYGYNYVQNGWMGDIWSLNYDGETYLKAKISPSQPGVGRKDYDTWILVKADSSVETGHCSCPAGNAHSCSHIAALIYAVTLAWSNGIAGQTCTDKLQIWGKGATNVLSHDPISQMNFDRPNQFILTNETSDSPGKVHADSDSTSNIEQFVSHEDLIEFATNSSVGRLWDCKGTMLNKILLAPVIKERKEIEVVHQDHCVDSSNPVNVPLSCGKCETFFKQFIDLSPEKATFFTENTKTQDSNLWLDTRKLRVTSSRVSSLPKTQRADPNKFITNQIYPRFKGCTATRHGQKFEPVARAWFESTTNQTVAQSGIVVSEKEPYIAASPDGIIDNSTILEIKCPTRPLKELINSGKYDVVMEAGEPKLSAKGKNGYYLQVQIAMFCTQTILCKFVLWTPDDKCIIDVPYNEQVVSNILPRIRDFYFRHILIRLSDEYESVRLKLC
ncbi:uncharacterized protein LOC132742209 [Ruditapes philippinarum]|uniref:uncharacterized protein LOC132742209 n=1 Tax=Ruditapes philippinarum TaxID=129788 RepID=UPI00295B3C5D|nr:uncharacterized protein LOC132742209 [Ruditapes philippinarum]